VRTCPISGPRAREVDYPPSRSSPPGARASVKWWLPCATAITSSIERLSEAVVENGCSDRMWSGRRARRSRLVLFAPASCLASFHRPLPQPRKSLYDFRSRNTRLGLCCPPRIRPHDRQVPPVFRLDMVATNADRSSDSVPAPRPPVTAVSAGRSTPRRSLPYQELRLAPPESRPSSRGVTRLGPCGGRRPPCAPWWRRVSALPSFGEAFVRPVAR